MTGYIGAFWWQIGQGQLKFFKILQSSIRKMLEVIYRGLDLDQGFLELRLPPGQPGLCPSTLEI